MVKSPKTTGWGESIIMSHEWGHCIISKFLRKRETGVSQAMRLTQLQVYTSLWVIGEQVIIEEEEIKNTALILPPSM